MTALSRDPAPRDDVSTLDSGRQIAYQSCLCHIWGKKRRKTKEFGVVSPSFTSFVCAVVAEAGLTNRGKVESKIWNTQDNKWNGARLKRRAMTVIDVL